MNTILVIATVIFTVSTGVSEEPPYLVIKTSNGPLLTSRIEVSHGHNLSLYCAVYPKHHSALWQAKNKRIKSSNATLSIYNLRDSDLGSYNCVSPSAHIQKTVDVVKKLRKRQDSLQEIINKNNELIDIIMQEHKNSQHSLNSDWDKYERERAELAAQREKRRRGNRNIGIIIGALAIGSAVIVLLCVACKRCHERKPPPTISSHQQSRNNNTAQTLVNPYESSPLCRPIETSITPYPPERGTVAPSAPAAEPECPPPPSYEEAVYDAPPTVPHLSAQNPAKM